MNIQHLDKETRRTTDDKDSNEVHVHDDIKEDRRDLMCLLKEYSHLDVEEWGDQRVQDATRIYEMFLVSGLNAGAATRKIVELFSPPRVTRRLEQMRLKGLEVGGTFDLRPNKHGDSYDLSNPRDRGDV